MLDCVKQDYTRVKQNLAVSVASRLSYLPKLILRPEKTHCQNSEKLLHSLFSTQRTSLKRLDTSDAADTKEIDLIPYINQTNEAKTKLYLPKQAQDTQDTLDTLTTIPATIENIIERGVEKRECVSGVSSVSSVSKGGQP